ncbi:jg6096 [Pararge aegeria aegeria]|uniref:Jg6096 protein n=1 Tax=Pararge aegeria aegeria TaxID=348720 RepID=A0A8S4S3Q0_9NEOP|nr:jg6096 [Pararge aegeria aegeria]
MIYHPRIESYLEPSEDLKCVKESLTKASNNLSTLKTKFDKNLYLRTETLLNHLYHRVNRISQTPDTVDLYKSTHIHFKSLYRDMLGLKPQASQELSDKQSDSTILSVTCERNLISEISKIKYSGKTCVRAFIQKVEEFVTSRSITYDKLLTFAYEIFTEDALHWYRCVKDNATSWNELVLLLKQDFGSQDYDYRLLAEIRSRTQGESENIAVYLSIMHGMFSRLGKKISDEDKLEILLHNIRPCYASTLASAKEISDVEQLKTLCRNYETIQSRLTQFHEPPKVTSDTVAPEFAYASTSSANTTYKYAKLFNNYKSYPFNFNQTYKNQSNKNLPAVAAVSANVAEEKRQVYCPRCRSETHSLRQCTKPRFLICFKCGKKDVRYPDCPECHSNNQQKN